MPAAQSGQSALAGSPQAAPGQHQQEPACPQAGHFYAMTHMNRGASIAVELTAEVVGPMVRWKAVGKIHRPAATRHGRWADRRMATLPR